MAQIGIVLRPGVKAAKELAQELHNWCEENEHQVVMDTETAAILEFDDEVCELSKIVNHADPIVTLGGDGTLIGVARFVSRRSPVMLGVNFGQLGFLTEIAPKDLFTTLKALLSGKATVAERRMVKVSVEREGAELFKSSAVNDAVIQKGSREKLVNLDLIVDGEQVMHLRGDGMIIGTPTGSTAYSLAAGGSIVHPSLAVAMITPICPHSLTARPLVLPLELNLEVHVPEYSGELNLIIDGQASCSLVSGDIVRISKSRHVVRFVRSASESYFKILRDKLNWGIENKA